MPLLWYSTLAVYLLFQSYITSVADAMTLLCPHSVTFNYCSLVYLPSQGVCSYGHIHEWMIFLLQVFSIKTMWPRRFVWTCFSDSGFFGCFPWSVVRRVLSLIYPSIFQLSVHFKIHLTMKAHEHTLWSISCCHDPLRSRCSGLFIRASCILHPLPSHVSSFHKSGFIQDLSMSDIGCLSTKQLRW